MTWLQLLLVVVLMPLAGFGLAYLLALPGRRTFERTRAAAIQAARPQHTWLPRDTAERWIASGGDLTYAEFIEQDEREQARHRFARQERDSWATTMRRYRQWYATQAGPHRSDLDILVLARIDLMLAVVADGMPVAIAPAEARHRLPARRFEDEADIARALAQPFIAPPSRAQAPGRRTSTRRRG